MPDISPSYVYFRDESTHSMAILQTKSQSLDPTTSRRSVSSSRSFVNAEGVCNLSASLGRHLYSSISILLNPKPSEMVKEMYKKNNATHAILTAWLPGRQPVSPQEAKMTLTNQSGSLKVVDQQFWGCRATYSWLGELLYQLWDRTVWFFLQKRVR